MLTFRKAAILIFSFVISNVLAEDGYRLWLRYDLINNQEILKEYKTAIQSVYIEKTSPTLTVAKAELLMATKGLLGIALGSATDVTSHGTLILGTPATSKLIASLKLDEQLTSSGPEGYVIISAEVKGKKCTIIAATMMSEFCTEHFISSAFFKLRSMSQVLQFKAFRASSIASSITGII